MKLKVKDNTLEKIKTLKIKVNSLNIQFCEKGFFNPYKYFSSEDNLKSFPPNGKLKKTELDYFYYIYLNDNVVGFYRITDLYFSNKIELHGSFSLSNTFLIKSYFELTRLFVSQIFILFPAKKIQTVVNNSNKKVFRFLNYLNFIKIEGDENQKNYSLFEKPSDIKIKKIEFKPRLNSTSFNLQKYIYLDEFEKKLDYHDKCFYLNNLQNIFFRVIKISNTYFVNNKLKKKTIYRRVIHLDTSKKIGTITENQIGLLSRDIKLLNIKKTENSNLMISDNIFYLIPFFIFNPNMSKRIFTFLLCLIILVMIIIKISINL
jgi:hypothetical protein